MSKRIEKGSKSSYKNDHDGKKHLKSLIQKEEAMPKGSDEEIKSDFTIDEKEIEAAEKQFRMMTATACYLASSQLETYKAVIEEVVKTRKKTLDNTMNELLQIDEEKDYDKRVDRSAEVINKQTESFLKDLTAIGIKAMNVSQVYTRKATKKMQDHGIIDPE